MPEIARNRRAQFSTKWNQFDQKYTPLWVADMDFTICPAIHQALQEAAKNETFGYTTIWPSAYQTVVDWCQQQYDWEIDHDWIVWLPGIVPAFHLINELFHQVDHHIAIPSPNYPPLLNSAKNVSANFITLPHYYSQQEQRWRLDIGNFESLVKQQKVSILSLANPANPLGYVLSQAELSQLNELCAEHNVLICSDEIHCDLSFSKEKHIPMGKISPKNSITLMAASKTFNIAGLNTAFAIIPDPEIRIHFKTAASNRIGSPNLLGLTATETAFTQGNPWRLDVLEYLQKNRDFIHQWGLEHGLQEHYLPAATHLYWLRIPSQKWTQNGIMPSKGSDFGDSRYSRINFACEQALLQQALQTLTETNTL